MNDKFCTNCGAEVNSNDKVCANCGQKLNKSNDSNIENDSSTNSENLKSNSMNYDNMRNEPNYSSRTSNTNYREEYPPLNKSRYNYDSNIIKKFFNFDVLITPYILKFFFIILTVLGILAIPLSFIIAIVEHDIGYMFSIFIVPIWLVFLRVLFELSIAILKLVENTNVIKEDIKKQNHN